MFKWCLLVCCIFTKKRLCFLEEQEYTVVICLWFIICWCSIMFKSFFPSCWYSKNFFSQEMVLRWFCWTNFRWLFCLIGRGNRHLVLAVFCQGFVLLSRYLYSPTPQVPRLLFVGTHDPEAIAMAISITSYKAFAWRGLFCSKIVCFSTFILKGPKIGQVAKLGLNMGPT